MSERPDPQTLLCFRLYAASHAFTRFYKPILEPLGLTYPQYLVLLALIREDERSVGALGAELMLDTNTLSPLLKRLEGMGLISRRRLPEDERRVVVGLTDKGRGIAERAAAIPDCISTCLDMDPDDLHSLIDTLGRLGHRLSEATPPQTPS